MYSESNILYIHPQTPMFEPLTIPISLPALINRIPYPVKGFSHRDVKNEDIKKASIIIIDIHWYLSLLGAKQLVERIKNINKSVTVIAGGITASEYATELAENLNIDYVIRGDAEYSLPKLVQALIENTFIDNIPNLVGKNGFKTEWKYKLTKEDIDSNSYYDIDFFPEFKQRIIQLHKQNKGWPPQLFPYLLPFRGCPHSCEICAGGQTEQQKIFQRSAIIRSADKLHEDLHRLNSAGYYKYVNVLHDFISLLPSEYSHTVLKDKTNLLLSYEFASAPNIEDLKILLNAFKGGVLYFCVDKKHVTSQELNEPSEIIKLINLVKKNNNYTPILNYSLPYAKSNSEYLKTVKTIIKHTHCLIYNASFWWTDFPIPDINGNAPANEFEKFLNYKNTSNHKKHIISNYLSHTINAVDIICPKPIPTILRRTYLRMAHNLPFCIKH